MFQSYKKKIQRINEDVSGIVQSAYESLENAEGSHTYNQYISYVKFKEIKCVIFRQYVKLNAISKVSIDNYVEYKIRGFQVKSRSYYNYPLDKIPMEVKAELADYLTNKAKLPKFRILESQTESIS